MRRPTCRAGRCDWHARLRSGTGPRPHATGLDESGGAVVCDSAGHGLEREHITDWAVHPGGPRILSMVEQALQLKADALLVSRDVLAQYGNMSSATIFFILESLFVQAHQSHSHGVPDTCIAMAFGPGLTTELALFQ